MANRPATPENCVAFQRNLRHCSVARSHTGAAKDNKRQMLAQIIESGQQSRLRSLIIVALLALIALTILQSAISHTGVVGQPRASDFDAFYLASRLVLHGNVVASYDYPQYVRQQVELLGEDFHLAWSYPPPYDLVVAPLALVPRGVAFGLFFAITAIAYLAVLWRVAAAQFVTMLVLLTLPVCLVVIFGQNGLLTGALAGLAVIGLRDRRSWAGVPLGLLIIKPHLAIALAAYVVVDRRWQVFAVAALTVGIASLLPVLLIAPDIWSAFAAGIAKTAGLLQGNFYPFRRMVSAYSALRSAGLGASPALAGQGLMAVTALAGIALAQRRLAPTVALGLAALLSLIISPYAYDYDLPVMAIGLALLLPSLHHWGNSLERSLVYGLFLIVALFGAWHTMSYGPDIAGRSPAGALHVAMLLLVGVIVARSGRAANA